MPWQYVINDLNKEKIVGTFYENELQKTNQKEFRTEKIITRKGSKLYVKWKCYDNSAGYLMSTQYKWVNIFLNQSL